MADDLKYFFLKTPMKRHVFMKIHRRYLPQEIIKAYELENIFLHDDHI